MDALDALDAVGESNVQLVRQVGSDQWDGATPCTEWNVRSLVGHLITGLDEQLIELSYEFYLPLMQKDAV
jgi:hypothetical protein